MSTQMQQATALADEARMAVRRVLDLVLRDGVPVVAVDSPPGAGKTSLVEALVATAVQGLGLRVAVVTPRAEQANDLLRRLVRDYVPMPMQLLKARGREVPDDVAALPGLSVASSANELLGGSCVVVGTAAKAFLTVPQLDGIEFDVLICDEAYQIAYKDFVALFEIAEQVVLIGDPGQLPPLVEVDTARFEAAPYRVHWPVPKEILRRFDGVPVVQLPASRRLPQDTVEIIQPSFYPELPFASLAEGDRRIEFGNCGTGDAIDDALDRIAEGATMVGILLPPVDLLPAGIDDELANLAADVAARFVARAPEWPGHRRLEARDLGCVDPHVASGAALRLSLQQRGLSTNDVMVDTPEIWQGLERPVMIAKHPLSGLRRFDEFSLEPGRFCVMLSRHQLACIIVGRDGVGDALERHSHNCARRALGAENAEWAGWRAHSRVWDALEQWDCLIQLG